MFSEHSWALVLQASLKQYQVQGRNLYPDAHRTQSNIYAHSKRTGYDFDEGELGAGPCSLSDALLLQYDYYNYPTKFCCAKTETAPFNRDESRSSQHSWSGVREREKSLEIFKSGQSQGSP